VIEVFDAREHGEEAMFFELSKLHLLAMRKTGRSFLLDARLEVEPADRDAIPHHGKPQGRG
jgi:hypothetical protein